LIHIVNNFVVHGRLILGAATQIESATITNHSKTGGGSVDHADRHQV